MVQTGQITVNVYTAAGLGVIVVAFAGEVVFALAVGNKQTELVIRIKLHVITGLQSVNISVELKRRIDFGRMITRYHPQVGKLFAVPGVIIQTAVSAVVLIVCRFGENVADHVSGLFKRCGRQAGIGNDFAGHFIGIAVQVPVVVFVNGPPVISAAVYPVNRKIGCGRSIVVRRFDKQDFVFRLNIFGNDMRHYTGAAFDVAVNFQHIGNFFFRIDVDMEKRTAFCRIIAGNGCPAAAFLTVCQ